MATATGMKTKQHQRRRNEKLKNIEAQNGLHSRKVFINSCFYLCDFTFWMKSLCIVCTSLSLGWWFIFLIKCTDQNANEQNLTISRVVFFFYFLNWSNTTATNTKTIMQQTHFHNRQFTWRLPANVFNIQFMTVSSIRF